MEFEWDERKRRAVREKHGVDIVHAALIFDGPVLTKIDSRADYGERHEISLGMVGQECFVVVHTSRDGVTRLISAWKGGRHDIAQYRARIAERDSRNE